MTKIASILLIEDDHLDVINFQRTLQKINLTHILHVAKNGEEALLLLKGSENEKAIGTPDIVLLDLNMPKMNGIEFLQVIRADDKLKDLKVFIITTSSEPEDKETAKKLGISGYITKPFSTSSSSKDGFSLLIDLMNLKS